ncbi:Myc-type, basic helix-loop-helix [Sesbania bispinosa]|nr:Myc-type, basic helix-loop-helix [Sesbania bispinosa]
MSHILSLEESTVNDVIPKETHKKHYDDEQSKEKREELQNRKSKRCRSSSQIQDHIIAERKRRENLTKMFIALSAVIPGLKKMDKASIMKNAINYVKYLQKSVKDLQEQNMKRKNMESVVCLRNEKSNIVTVADNYKPLNRSPIIEVRVLAKDVFIRVVCENRKNVLVKLLAKLEAHNLSVVGSNTIPFGNSTLNITITARVDNDFSMTKDELVKKLMEDLLETYD